MSKNLLLSCLVIICVFFSIYIYQLLFFNELSNAKISLISVVRNLNVLLLLSLILYFKIRKPCSVNIIDVVFIISLILLVRIPILSLFLPVLILLGMQNYEIFRPHYVKVTYKRFCWFIVSILLLKGVIDFTKNSGKLEAIWNDSYTNSVPSEVEAAILETVPSDYMFLHLKESGKSYRSSINGKMKGLPELHGFVPVTITNTQLKLSKYIGDFAHFYGNKAMFEEHLSRLSTINDIACVANFGLSFCVENNKQGEVFIDDNLSLLIEVKKPSQNVDENLIEVGFQCREVTSIYLVCVPD